MHSNALRSMATFPNSYRLFPAKATSLKPRMIHLQNGGRRGRKKGKGEDRLWSNYLSSRPVCSAFTLPPPFSPRKSLDCDLPPSYAALDKVYSVGAVLPRQENHCTCCKEGEKRCFYEKKESKRRKPPIA